MAKMLIVVDMINDFIDEDGVLSLKEEGFKILPVIEEKLSTAAQNDDIVVYLNDGHEPDDKEFERFPKHAVAGTWGSKVVDTLTPTDNDFVITKQRYSGFHGTALGAVIADLQPEEIEVCGCCTSICVAGTVADLVNNDYKVVVDRKAVADFNQEAHEFFLNYQLPAIYGAVIV